MDGGDCAAAAETLPSPTRAETTRQVVKKATAECRMFSPCLRARTGVKGVYIVDPPSCASPRCASCSAVLPPAAGGLLAAPAHAVRHGHATSHMPACDRGWKCQRKDTGKMASRGCRGKAPIDWSHQLLQPSLLRRSQKHQSMTLCSSWPKLHTRVTSRQVTLHGCDRHQCQIGFPIV